MVVTDGESHDGEELPAALKACEAGRVTRYGIAVRLCSGPGRVGWGRDGDIRTGNLRKTTSQTPASFPSLHFGWLCSVPALISQST